MSKKDAKHSTNNPSAVAAGKLHKEIATSSAELIKKWTLLACKCQEFKDSRYYKYILNPETKKPFRSFAAWVASVFGTSKSTIYASMRTVKTLEPLMSHDDINEMPKQNAGELAKLVEAGGNITPDLKEAAKHESVKDLRKRLGKPVEASTAESAGPVLGPFAVKAETAADFLRAMTIAEVRTQDQAGDPVDRSLSFIARNFLMEYEHITQAAAA
jgi:hypothetical protein